MLSSSLPPEDTPIETSNESQPDPWIGQIIVGKIRKYTIVKRLRRGSSGVSFKAVDAETGRNYVVKLLLPEIASLDQDSRKRFERDADVLKKLEGTANVVGLLEENIDGIAPYLVKRFLEGGNLREYFPSKGDRHRINEDFLKVFEFIAKTLDQVHKKGVIHRDLKPENILLETLNDGSAKPYINDFEIATFRDASHVTKTRIGTDHYMAPEMWGTGKLTQQVDIYALGVMLYEILEGKFPFEGTPAQIENKHLNEEVPRPVKIENKYGKKVANVILKALSKEPGQRYTSASKLMNAFRKAYEEYPKQPTNNLQIS